MNSSISLLLSNVYFEHDFINHTDEIILQDILCNSSSYHSRHHTDQCDVFYEYEESSRKWYIR